MHTAALTIHPDVQHLLLHYDPTSEERWLDLLPVHEQDRWQGYRHVGRRRSFLLGRVSARLLLSQELGLPPRDVPLVVADDGALDVEEHPLHVSIAHSGDRAVAAIAESAVGVDLERVQPRREDLHEAILHPDEHHLLQATEFDREHATILFWTLKEATLKGLRTGLRKSPKDLRLDVNVSSRSATVQMDDGKHWHARFELLENYFLAIAQPALVATPV